MLDNGRAKPTSEDVPPATNQSTSHTTIELRQFFSRFDVRVALAYGFVAALWIFFSDSFVNMIFAGDQAEATAVSIWKGWGFVFITTLALFMVLSAELRKRTRVEEALRLDVLRRALAEKSEREQHRYAEAMRDSLEALTSTLDVNTVMSQILDQAAHVLTYDAASILQMDAQRVHVVYCRGFATSAKDYVFDFGKDTPLPAHFASIRAGKPYLINETNSVTGWADLAITAWIRSTIGVPIIMRGGDIFGVLAVDSAAPNSYTHTEVERLQAFARYAALALENAYHTEFLEQRVAQRTNELQSTKERTEAILNSSMDSILLLTDDLIIQQTNVAFDTLFGSQPDAYIGKSLIDSISSEDAPLVSKTVQGVLTERQGHHVECQMLRMDQPNFDAELSFGYIDAINGHGHGLVCTIRDVSERNAYERQLRYHASLQETVTDAVITTDVGFRIQAWNRAAETIYGWQAEEVIGKPVDDVLQTKFLSSETIERVKNDFLEKGNWSDEVIQQRKDGSPIHILSSVVLYKNEFGTPFGIVAVNHDISARKQTEQTLRDALAKEKDLSELKSRFVSMASHEFRTPLATMLALTDTLSNYRQKMTEAQIENRFQKMREQIQRLTEITEDVLHLTKLQAKKAEFNPIPLNLDALCRSIIEEFQSRPDVHHPLLYSADGFDCEPMLDKKLMWKLINNLMTNAIKYSPQGKEIYIDLRCSDHDIELRVRDQGIGIPEADLKHLFEPFHRAANVGGISGTGLGLVIAKEAVELHNGTLSVDSQVGVGTTFIIRLPMVKAEAQDPDPEFTSP